MILKGIFATISAYLIATGIWKYIKSEFGDKPSSANDDVYNRWFSGHISVPNWLYRINKHNYVFGHRELGDRLIYYNRTKQEGKLFRIVTTDVECSYRVTNANSGATITCIRVLDKKKDGLGGTVQVILGGVGFPIAILRLTSIRSFGYDFLIEIYGIN